MVAQRHALQKARGQRSAGASEATGSAVVQRCPYGHREHEDLARCPYHPSTLTGLPPEVRTQIYGYLGGQDMLNLRAANTTMRAEVTDWGNLETQQLLTDPEGWLAQGTNQTGTPYPDIRAAQERAAAAATAAHSEQIREGDPPPTVKKLQKTLGPKSSAAPDKPFMEGGGFTFESVNGTFEAHPGGGQHSGRTNKFAAIPSTPEFGGAYIRTGQHIPNIKKVERRFSKYGEFGNTQNFWAPLDAGKSDAEFKVDDLSTHRTGGLIRQGTEALNGGNDELSNSILAELLRRFVESQKGDDQDERERKSS